VPFSALFESAAQARVHAGKGNLAVALPKMKLFFGNSAN
jgi:hypothetical protein